MPDPRLTTAPTTYALSDEQRARAVAAHEAARMILHDDPPPEDIIMIAAYIVTGRRPPPDIKVLPDESLLEQVVQRVANATVGVGPPGGDAATWTADPGGWKPYPPGRGPRTDAVATAAEPEVSRG